VNSVPLQVVLYAFVAAASPVAHAATLVVLGSRGGRWNGTAFAIGVVAGQALLCLVAFLVGNATLPVGHHAHETARGMLELAFGVALLIAGAVLWRRPPDAPAKPDSRTKAVLARLARLNPFEAVGTGVVLDLGPKRLGLTLLACATIASGDLGPVAGFALTATYVVIATVMVTVPVVLAVVFGRRGQQWMLGVEHWLSAHKRPLTFYPLTILGVLVVVDALVSLASRGA
jgi:threonine/homoserine/homoserine lactone efflux protein